MSTVLAPEVLAASGLMVPTLLALAHLTRFPFVRGSAIPTWFLLIVLVPGVGPAAWSVYALARVRHARALIEDLAAPR